MGIENRRPTGLVTIRYRIRFFCVILIVSVISAYITFYNKVFIHRLIDKHFKYNIPF